MTVDSVKKSSQTYRILLGTGEVGTFTTGSGFDTMPPRGASVKSTVLNSAPPCEVTPCGLWSLVSLTVASGDEDPLLYQATLSRPGTSSVRPLGTGALGLFPHGDLAPGQAGYAICVTLFDALDEVLGLPVRIRLMVEDLSGNRAVGEPLEACVTIPAYSSPWTTADASGIAVVERSAATQAVDESSVSEILPNGAPPSPSACASCGHGANLSGLAMATALLAVALVVRSRH